MCINLWYEASSSTLKSLSQTDKSSPQYHSEILNMETTLSSMQVQGGLHNLVLYIDHGISLGRISQLWQRQRFWCKKNPKILLDLKFKKKWLLGVGPLYISLYIEVLLIIMNKYIKINWWVGTTVTSLYIFFEVTNRILKSGKDIT